MSFTRSEYDATREQEPTCLAIADCNSFYASCEAVFKPSLLGKPVVVLSNNDGIVIARSKEAKALGIKMGSPAHEMHPHVRMNGLTICSANFALYDDLSQRVMHVLNGFTPSLGVYSIDEAFLDFAHVPVEQRHAYAAKVRATVFRWTGIHISVGIGATKTLAKAANEAAKKSAHGVVHLHTDSDVDHLLAKMALEDIWGIGHRRANFLREHDIRTALDFKYAPHPWIKKRLYLPVARTQLELRGLSCLPFEAQRPDKQQIMSSRSFGRAVCDLDELKEAVALYTTRAAEKLRRQHSHTKVLTVFVATNSFREGDPQYSKSVTVTLSRATNYTAELVTSAHRALERIYREGYAYHRAGVVLSNLMLDTYLQADLFDAPPDPRRQCLMQTVDQINARFGRDMIHPLATGNERRWRMKQEHLSPRYTTRKDDLAKVR